ncbi:MAG: pyridoxal phosphate-dependent aminotransferase [Muribaculaceae bacterium]|nr:pyridoxal phosphate-dependent aminotransferase [Muribaculaceae bacterium]
MSIISQRIERLSPSATLAMSQKSAELKAKGVDVINMSVGEPDFNTPEHIKEAAKRAIDENFSRYTPVAGYLSLRQAVCDKLLRENGISFSPEQIVVGNGAKQELYNALLACVDPGEEVIIPTPAWVSYVEMVKLAEGKVVEVPAGIENDFKITPDQLKAAISPKTKMLMLNSPCNPTGSIYTYDELKGLAEVLEQHPDILILADEIYEHINFVGKVHSISEFPALRDRVIIVNGVSKAYAMTGWRIGYLAAPLKIAKAVSKLQGQSTSGASSIAQKAAEAAYNGSQNCIEEMRKAFERRRDLIVELAKEVPGWQVNRPDGAFYLFPKVDSYVGAFTPDGRRLESVSDYVMYLLEEAHVACVDGEAFCAPGYMRLSYATSDDNIREAIRRIREASLRLKNI